MLDSVIVGGCASGSIPSRSRHGELEDSAALSGRRGRRFHVGGMLTTWSGEGREGRGKRGPPEDERVRRGGGVRGGRGGGAAGPAGGGSGCPQEERSADTPRGSATAPPTTCQV